jgi:hypothetical protein
VRDHDQCASGGSKGFVCSRPPLWSSRHARPRTDASTITHPDWVRSGCLPESYTLDGSASISVPRHFHAACKSEAHSSLQALSTVATTCSEDYAEATLLRRRKRKDTDIPGLRCYVEEDPIIDWKSIIMTTDVAVPFAVFAETDGSFELLQCGDTCGQPAFFTTVRRIGKT